MGYSLAQMQSILRQAGWPESLIVTMAAIGMAESSGNPNAHNAVPPDDSYGLWQINMIGSLGPQRRAKYGLSSNSALYDPLTNARVALDVYQQQGLRAWGPYVTGVYQRYLPQSQAVYMPGASVAPGAVTTAATETQSGDSSNAGDYPDSGIDAPGNSTTQLLVLGAAVLGAIYLLKSS